MKYSLGIDIGGTKCAVVLGKGALDCIDDFIIDKISFPTCVSRGWRQVVSEIISKADELLYRNNVEKSQLIGVGVSCGVDASDSSSIT